MPSLRAVDRGGVNYAANVPSSRASLACAFALGLTACELAFPTDDLSDEQRAVYASAGVAGHVVAPPAGRAGSAGIAVFGGQGGAAPTAGSSGHQTVAGAGGASKIAGAGGTSAGAAGVVAGHAGSGGLGAGSGGHAGSGGAACVPATCDDGNECTTDKCGPSGCDHAPRTGSTCGQACGAGTCDGAGNCAAPAIPAAQEECIGAAPCGPGFYPSSYACDKALCQLDGNGECGFCNNSFLCSYACAETIFVCFGGATSIDCPSGYTADAATTMTLPCGACGAPGKTLPCHLAASM